MERKVITMVDAEYTYLNPCLNLLTLAMMLLNNGSKPLVSYTYQNYLKVSLFWSIEEFCIDVCFYNRMFHSTGDAKPSSEKHRVCTSTRHFFWCQTCEGGLHIQRKSTSCWKRLSGSCMRNVRKNNWKLQPFNGHLNDENGEVSRKILHNHCIP